MAFYDVRMNRRHPRDLRDELLRRLADQRPADGARPWLLVPLHVRSHWTTAVLTASDSRLLATVIDSAPALATRNDIAHLARRVEITVRAVATPIQQPHGSNDCGVHVVMYGIIAAVGGADQLLELPDGKAVDVCHAPLTALRAALADKRVAGLTLADAARLAPCLPVLPFDCPWYPRSAAVAAPAAHGQPLRYGDVEREGVDAPVGGAAPAPPGLSNPPGQNVCFANSTVQALGRPECLHAALARARTAGINFALQDGSRRQEDAGEFLAAATSELGLGDDEVVIRRDTVRPCRCVGGPTFESAPFVQGIAATTWHDEIADCACPNCGVVGLASCNSEIVAAPRQLVFVVGRARADGTVDHSAFRCPNELPVCGRRFLFVGIVCWTGATAHSGHYYAYRRAVGGPWACCNDSVVSLGAPPVRDVERYGVIAVYEPLPPASAPFELPLPRSVALRRAQASATGRPAAMSDSSSAVRSRASSAATAAAVSAASATTKPSPSALWEAAAAWGATAAVADTPPATGAVAAALAASSGAAPALARGSAPAQATPAASTASRLRLRLRGAHASAPGLAAPAPSPPNDPRAAPMPHNIVRRAVAQLAAGSVVVTDWSFVNGRYGGCWAGTIAHAATARAAALVSYTQAVCSHCAEWHALAEPVDAELPRDDVAYHMLSLPASMPASTVDCGAEDDEAPVDRDADDDAPPAALDAATEADARRELLGAEQLAPVVPAADPSHLRPRGNFLARRLILHGRPAHVSPLAWARVAASTRAAHCRWLHRIRAMPADLCNMPLGSALIELVLRWARPRHLAWSTIASYLSCVASALNELPLYSNAPNGVDVRKDTVFNAAVSRAQHMARISSMQPDAAQDLTHEKFTHLAAGITEPTTWLLAQLSWFFAARVGDMRQVRSCDVALGDTNADGTCLTTITFRFGKGAAFWGPYSIRVVLPQAVVQHLAARRRLVRDGEALFADADQDRLSKAVAELRPCTLRSFRRGALLFLAACGVTDDDLQLLSGHRRRDTLLRYLGWGRLSSSAGAAAGKRAALAARAVAGSAADAAAGETAPDPTGRILLFDVRRSAAVDPKRAFAAVDSDPEGGEYDHDGHKLVLPPKMGVHSGYTGHFGQRVKKPPTLFAPPSGLDLLFSPIDPAPFADWPLHVKFGLPTVEWSAITDMAAGTPLAAPIECARRWTCSSEFYHADWADLTPSQIPVSRLSPDDVATLLRAEKLVPHVGPIRSFAVGWLLAQLSKKRFRPIFEPRINASLDLDTMLRVQHPSRKERRAQAHGQRFQVEFDFMAYYDQFVLDEAVRPYFVVRVKDADGHDALYALTRLPMGARFAVGVAQYVTWLATAPIASYASTCIDNVRITAVDATEFVRAVRTFLARVGALGITINDADQWRDLSDAEIMQRGHHDKAGPFLFLGEEYAGDTVRNSEKSVTRLRDAFDACQKRDGLVTRRWFAAIAGLIVFMAHTVDIGLWRHFALLRAYSRLVSPSATVHGDVRWDEPFRLSVQVRWDLGVAVGRLLANQPVPLRPLLPPGSSSDDYDVVIIVDASISGWGAYVRVDGKYFLLSSGWRVAQSFSAHAEPSAALEAVEWARRRRGGRLGHVAVVTDHFAMASGQRRWWSGYAGFSPAYPLNRFFETIYGADDLGAFRRDVFYVEGEKNIADGPSRSVDIGQPLTVSAAPNSLFPDVRTFWHPYAERPRREHWQV
jgi:hypothetical protein